MKMKHLKNYLGLSLVFVLVFTIALATVACTDDSGNENNTTATTTETPTTTADNSTETTNPTPTKPTYTVTVVDQNGAPIAGVVVQSCADGLCNPLGKTDANGKISKKLTEKDYEVSVTKANGYVFDPDQKYDFEAGEEVGTFHVTIVLTADTTTEE